MAHVQFVFTLILILILIYLNPYMIEKFYLYRGGEYGGWEGIQTQDYAKAVPPLNAYKFPAYPLVSPAMSPYELGYYIPYSNGYTDLPWNNTSLGNTTNMSYDIRGDPLIIPRTNFVWNNGTNFPIYNAPV